MDKTQFIKIAEIANILGVSRVTATKLINRLRSAGDLETEVEGGILFIKKDSLPQDLKDKMKLAQENASKKLVDLKPTKGQKDLSFERQLWEAADKLRGNIDASDYKHVVLGLLFLKYVSDSFYQRREELEQKTADPKEKEFYIPNEADRKVIIDDKDQYKSAGVFFIPKKARWDFLRDHASHSEIGKYIDEAMDAIENENPKLKGVLPKNYQKSTLESHILGELVNVFSKIEFDHNIEKEKDILGRVYEYFLSQFASAEGKRGGEFFTPRSIVQLIVEILEPFENARIFDPACGSGGMFVQSSEFLKKHKEDASHIAIYGQESNPTTLKLAKMNLALRGIENRIEYGNTYYEDKFPDLRADFVIANPPFNAEWDPKRLSDNDPRIQFGTPPSGNANFMWIQHFIHHLAPNGLAGFVMANGALAVGGKEGEIRKQLIEKDLVDVIVACPPKLFYSVTLPVSLWFLTKSKNNGRFRKRVGETLFIDARETFTQISRKQVEFTKDDIDKIAGTVRAWRGEKDAAKYEDVAGYCKSTTKEEIAKNGYVLTPGRYVGVAEEEDDGVPFEEKMEKLSIELQESFKKGQDLEKNIMQNLKSLRTN